MALNHHHHHHHHHHHLLFALFTQYKKIYFTAVIARRRGDQGSHRAYGRATSLILLNKVKKSAANVRLGQFSDYLSKNSCIFVLKLRRFDERMTETLLEIA